MSEQKIKYYFSLLLICFIVNTSRAQLQKANQLYEKNDFGRAISYFEKLYVKDTINLDIILKLGECYRKTMNYKKAEEYYEKAVKFKNVDIDVELQYIEILKNNGKISDARAKTLMYVRKLNNDILLKKYQDAYDELLEWKKGYPYYEVTNVKSINTQASEFSPVAINDKLVFISERNSDYTNSIELGEKGRLLLSINEAEKEDEIHFNNRKSFSSTINSDTHNGPICFNQEGTESIFTRVVKTRDENKDVVFKPQLYVSRFNGEKWERPKPFEQNDERYIFEQPYLSSDGNTLYFVSDMNGGYGGTDIYFCKKENGHWNKPQNLGAVINTVKDEKFPYFYADNTLFFSSDGFNGYGGLDIFSSFYNGETWETPINLKSPINSSTDDFGITFSDSTHGYFSSNRPGGAGRDDIYNFKKLNNRTNVKGILTLDNAIPGKRVKMDVIDKNNEKLAPVITQASGSFVMKDIAAEQSYAFVIDDERANQKTSKIFLTNDNGHKIAELSASASSHIFQFNTLSVGAYNGMKTIDIADDEKSTITWGKVFKKLPGDIPAGLSIQLVNDDGEIIYSVLTDEKGTFQFKNLPSDMNFIVKTNENENDLKMMFINQKDGMANKAMNIGAGHFIYRQTVKDTSILLQQGLYGKLFKKLPGDIPAGIEVQIINDDGVVMFTTITDNEGNFQFKELPSNVNYIIKINSKDEEEMKLLFLNSKGDLINAARKNKKGDFQLIDTKKTLNTSSPLIGRVYNKLTGEMPKGLIIQVVDDNGKIIFSTTTDADGNFKLKSLPTNSNYSLKIVTADGGALQISYMRKDGKLEAMTQNIENGLFTMQTPADESLQTTFFSGKLFHKLSTEMPAGLEIYLVDDDGEILFVTVTDQDGNFNFANLPQDIHYTLKMGDDNNLSMILFNEEGIAMDTIQKDANGNFVFRKMALQQELLASLKTVNISTDEQIQFTNIPVKKESVRTKTEEKIQDTKTTDNIKQEVKPVITNNSAFESIYYAFDQWNISPEAARELDKLVDLMKEKPEIKVNLNSYTDAKGSASYNLLLSERRSNVVRNYLIKKGISKDRITAQGFGETNFLNNCSNNVWCPPSERAINRRTEIQLIN